MFLRLGQWKVRTSRGSVLRWTTTTRRLQALHGCVTGIVFPKGGLLNQLFREAKMMENQTSSTGLKKMGLVHFSCIDILHPSHRRVSSFPGKFPSETFILISIYINNKSQSNNWHRKKQQLQCILLLHPCYMHLTTCRLVNPTTFLRRSHGGGGRRPT